MNFTLTWIELSKFRFSNGVENQSAFLDFGFIDIWYFETDGCHEPKIDCYDVNTTIGRKISFSGPLWPLDMLHVRQGIHPQNRYTFGIIFIRCCHGMGLNIEIVNMYGSPHPIMKTALAQFVAWNKASGHFPMKLCDRKWDSL